MEYKGYKIVAHENRITVENIKDFHPVHIFECGQCFRWVRQSDGSHTGVVGDRVVNVKYAEGRLDIHNAVPEDFAALWYDYFDLGRDYSDIKRKLRVDAVMREAIAFGHGMRLLRQDFWETLLSFIISANNNVPRIMKIVGAISRAYGKRIEWGGGTYYTFPTADSLADQSVEQLDVCKGGYRCKYIAGTSRMIRDGAVRLEALGSVPAGNARKELMRLNGVGPKVADCILLYSGTRYDVFPTDVWVKRVMEELYFGRETSFAEIQRFSAEYFGDLAGFAQQYLFYYAWTNKIGAQ